MAQLSILGVCVIFNVFCVSQQENLTNDFITPRNEAPSPRSRILYDYHNRVVAYKDLVNWQCLLEILDNGGSHIANWMANGGKGNISEIFLVSNQLLTRQQIWQLGGNRIAEFCKGFPTLMIIYPADGIQYADHVNDSTVNENLQNVRRKRATRHYFQGRLRGQTQSQYLNFGKTDQPGKAEAESTFESSKAVVSGTSGMGQAQSQSISLGCDECYGQGYGTNGYNEYQTNGFGQGRPGQRLPESTIQSRPGGVSGTTGGGRSDGGQTRGRPDQFEKPGQNGRTGGNGYSDQRRPDTQFNGTPDQVEHLRPEQNGRFGQNGKPGYGGTGNGHGGELLPPSGHLPEIHGRPPQTNGQIPIQYPIRQDQTSGRPNQVPEGPGRPSLYPEEPRRPDQLPDRDVRPDQVPNRHVRPDQIPDRQGRPDQLPDRYGGPSPFPGAPGTPVQVSEDSRKPEQLGNGNGKLGRPDQANLRPHERQPPLGRPSIIESDRYSPGPGKTEILGRPDISRKPNHPGVDHMGTVVDLGDTVNIPIQHGGTFGGQLTGDYQGNYGHSGRFSGQFSGQYEGIGSPYTEHVRPEGNRLIQPNGNAYQPQSGSGIDQFGSNGHGRVQSPSTSNVYQPGYEQGQPSYNGHGTISEGQGAGGGHQTGYRPNGVARQPQPTQYGSTLGGGQGSASGNGHDAYQPIGPEYGSHGTPESPNGHRIADQYGNGIQGGPSRQNGYQPGPGGESEQERYRPGPGYRPEYTSGGSNYESPSKTNGQTGVLSGSRPDHQPEYTDNLPPDRSQQSGVPTHYEQNGQRGSYGQDDKYVIGGNGHHDLGLQDRGQQGGTTGITSQYGDTNQNGVGFSGGQDNSNLEGQYFEDDADSQVQTSVQQMENGTHAKAQAQGVYGDGTAESEVSGTYTGSGSFSASAGTSDAKRGAHTQVMGGDYGARSSAQGRGGSGQTQANVILSSETGDTVSNAQSNGLNHGSQSEVQASEKGGTADAQANGPGSTSSQAQIGFSPYDENDEDNQTAPFRGGGTAGAQSGSRSGMSQAQMHGKFLYGIKYNGGAQADSGGTGFGRNSSFRPGPFTPVDISFYPKRPLDSFTTGKTQTQTHAQKVDDNEENNTTASITLSEDEPEQYSPSDDDDKNDNTEDGGDDYGEGGDYDTPTELPSTKNIITQSTRNQRQHIVLDPLEDLDITVHQSRGDFAEEGMVLHPGQTIPGTPGYRIPTGFRGTVKSMSNGRNTYAIGKNSQAQSVTLSPGTGKIIYTRPVYAVSSNTHFRNGQYGYGSGYTYQPSYRPVQYLLKNGKVLPNFVSVTKSETGSQNVYTGQRTPRVYYSQSSSCGMFTSQCVLNNGRKLCFPKAKTNPDGTLMGC